MISPETLQRRPQLEPYRGRGMVGGKGKARALGTGRAVRGAGVTSFESPDGLGLQLVAHPKSKAYLIGRKDRRLPNMPFSGSVA